MGLSDRVGFVATRGFEIAGDAVDIVSEYLDIISSASCFVGALACIYLAVVILKEHVPLVFLQRWSLGLLAIALFSNAALDIPNWMLVNGHRPTGTAVDVTLMLNVLVMAWRGSIMYQPHIRKNETA